MITHHPSLELLLDYASGALPEPAALSVACHLSFCPDCQAQVARLEEIGGHLLHSEDIAEVKDELLEAVLARLDEPEPEPEPMPEFDEQTKSMIPAPLRHYLGKNVGELAWRRMGSLVEEHKLDLSVAGFKAALMRFKAGSPMPMHSHKGQEFTLVLSGGYTDGEQHFIRGDFDANDPSDTHKPVVDEGEDCIAFVVLDAPLELKGLLGKIVNPFLKI